MGKISKGTNGNLTITPFELIKSNKTKESWKRNNNVEIPYASNSQTYNSYLVGDEITFLLAMGNNGPVAIQMERAVMIDPATNKTFEYGVTMQNPTVFCTLTETDKNIYFTKGHTELDTVLSTEVTDHLNLEDTSNAVHLIPTTSRGANNP